MKSGGKKMTWRKLMEMTATSLTGALIFGKLDDVIKKKLPNDVADSVFKGKLDKHLKPMLTRLNISKDELTKNGADAAKGVISKFVATGPGAAAYGKAVEAAFNSANGSESAEVIYKRATDRFISDSASMTALTDLLEKELKNNMKS